MDAQNPITAILYDDGATVAALSHIFVDEWSRNGLAACGLIEEKVERAGRRRCDMVLTEISGGQRILISEDRGSEARGCHLDVDAFAYAAGLVQAALENGVERVIFNKFGKVECEGGGLRATIAKAMEMGVPMIVFVPRKNLGPWREFVCGLGVEKELALYADLLQSQSGAAEAG